MTNCENCQKDISGQVVVEDNGLKFCSVSCNLQYAGPRPGAKTERQIMSTMITDDMVHAAREIVRIFNAEDGKREDFNAAAETLYQLTGRNLYRTGTIYAILDAANGILNIHVRQTAGNSGTH